jgi:hypothetical protein
LGAGKRENWDEYWKASFYKANQVIAFVRNPWDRTLSGYLFDKKYWYRHEKTHGPFPDLKTYLEGIIENGIGKCEWQTFKRQVDYIDIPIADLFFLGRHETLYDDFEKLCKKLSVEIPKKERFGYFHTRHGNKTRGEQGGPFGYREYYNKETKELVKKIYGADIKKFGYEF